MPKFHGIYPTDQSKHRIVASIIINTLQIAKVGFALTKVAFSLDNCLKSFILVVQSESVTLSVDYLISSAQAGFTCLGFFMVEYFSVVTIPDI